MISRAVMRLSVLLVSLGLGGAVGCVRHGAPRAGGSYRLVTVADEALLEPPGQGVVSGQRRSVAVALGDGPAAGGQGGAAACAIEGRWFALRPEPEGGRWRLESPDSKDWTDATQETAAEAEWSGFVVKLGELVARGCFPAGMSQYTVHRRLVEAMPLPAEKALRYYYSLTGSGYVDLQPGMQLGIETVTPGTPVAEPKSEVERLAVVEREPAGVALTRVNVAKAAAAGPYAALPRDFGRLPFLRVFLERAATQTEGERRAMLLGAATAGELDEATATIARGDEASCERDPGPSRCVVFSGSGLSLLTAVSVNGRTVFYAPGTTLAQIVDAVPEARRARAVATVTMERQTAAGMVPIAFARGEEQLMNLLLINGDRIRWR